MKMELTLYRSEIVPVYTTSLNNKVVDGRELHAFLGIGKDYSNWVKSVIKKHKLNLKEDYVIVTPNDITINGVSAKSGENLKGGRTKKEYIFQLAPAKKIAMGTNNAKGDEVKDYFLACEEVAIAVTTHQTAAPLLQEHAKREVQLHNSKAVASHLFLTQGLEAIPNYHRDACKGVCGKTPSQLRKEARANGLPSKVYNSGREVLRHTDPSSACALSLCDTVVRAGADVETAVQVATESKSLYQRLIDLKIIPAELMSASSKNKAA